MLALPASSLAQSAGDDQYQDPLAGQPSGGGHSGGGGSSGSTGSTGSTGSSGSAPVTPAPSAGTSAATTPQATAAQSSSGQLPRTGFDVILTIELGLAMLLTGVVAQRMVVLRDRRDQR
jgi:hypothetical protein